MWRTGYTKSSQRIIGPLIICNNKSSTVGICQCARHCSGVTNIDGVKVVGIRLSYQNLCPYWIYAEQTDQHRTEYNYPKPTFLQGNLLFVV